LGEYGTALDRLVALVPALAEIEGFEEQARVIGAMQVHRHLAGARAKLATTAEEIEDFGLGPLFRLPTPNGLRGTELTDIAMRVFAASAIESISLLEPELEMFDGAGHQQIAERFAELDGRHLTTTAQRVMRQVAARAATAMSENPRESALVRHEAGLQSLHMPVRQLIAHAPNVVQALRPCWAMSPLLVARMLPATRNLFDVVVFDEASQILEADAIPAIARGAQAVVAGDPSQLPPSQFFAAERPDDEDEPVDDSSDGRVESRSILDVTRGLMVEQRLLWHYRSEDERLINFSNMHTYDQSLVTFPGTNRGTGVHHVLVDGLPATAEETTSNPAVVDRVVELVLDHAATNPGESLGVIATGIRNAEAITEALRVARMAGSDDYGGFFEEKGAEPFVVKTIDLAQGDERDHIILSIGFGRNPDGDMAYRWGLVARAGGERRLNVAITRAKRRMTVVSSVSSHEIDPTRTRSRGAALLAQYLEYAERGGELSHGRDAVLPLTPFETSVRDRLQEAGIAVRPRYGVGQLRLDFAAFVDNGMTRPVLAIETDGAAYNSTVTARDGDRLRPEALRRRGWRHHRIWSIDWYRDPDGETAKVAASWERAVREADDLESFGRPSVVERPVVVGRGRSPIAVGRGGILAYQRAELVQLIRWIESDGVSRTDQEVLAAAVEVLGLKDSTGRVDRALRAAIEEAHGS
jgi:very-short-patch-repair endonuclease